jgi:trk system potassium uptake protein TrkH
VLNAVFHGAAARTAGFNAVATDAVTDAGLLVLIGLMFIGGASGSTAGGIKLQTFSLLFFAILSTAAGRQDIQAFRRRVPTAYVLRALTVALLALAVVFAVAFALSVTERAPFVALTFEAFSAFATVGLSTGITPDLSPAGRLIVTATMFVGRLGPLTLVVALAARERRTSYRWAEEGVKIG